MIANKGRSQVKLLTCDLHTAHLANYGTHLAVERLQALWEGRIVSSVFQFFPMSAIYFLRHSASFKMLHLSSIILSFAFLTVHGTTASAILERQTDCENSYGIYESYEGPCEATSMSSLISYFRLNEELMVHDRLWDQRN